MATYLLTWNPASRFKWDDQAEYAAEVAENGWKRFRWSFGNRKQAEIGDRVFLIKLGPLQPRGIVGSGYIIKRPYLDKQWDDKGKSAPYVNVEFDRLLDPMTASILEREDLDQPPLKSMHWDSQASGVRIPDEIAEWLEDVWGSMTNRSGISASSIVGTSEQAISRQSWWLNHNYRHDDQIEGGYMWSSRRNEPSAQIPAGTLNQFYLNLTRTRIGDIVFSFADKAIDAVGIVAGRCRQSDRPQGRKEPFGEKNGWFVPIAWTLLSKPFKPVNHIEEIRPLLPKKKYSPIQESGRGNRGCYLALISPELSRLLLSIANEPDIGLVSKEEYEDWLDDLEESRIRRQSIPKTEKVQLIKARRGQGIFRTEVKKIESFCRVTGVDDPRFLVASHIKAWRLSSNEERLDGNNGLLLSAHVDRLFDKGMVSFTAGGGVLCKPEARPIATKWRLDFKKNVGRFNKKQRVYLKFHRAMWGF